MSPAPPLSSQTWCRGQCSESLGSSEHPGRYIRLPLCRHRAPRLSFLLQPMDESANPVQKQCLPTRYVLTIFTLRSRNGETAGLGGLSCLRPSCSLDVAASVNPWFFFPSVQPVFGGLFRLMVYIITGIPIWPWEEVTEFQPTLPLPWIFPVKLVLKN